MSYVRLLLVGLLVALAIGTISVSPALGAPCVKETLTPAKHALCIEANYAAMGATPFITRNSLTSEYLVEVLDKPGGVELLHIVCTTIAGTGQFNVTGTGGELEATKPASKIKLQLKTCTSLQAGCTVAEPIKFEGNEKKGLIATLNAGLTKITFAPEKAEEEFGEVKVSGCTLAGNYVIKGDQECSITSIESEKFRETIECTGAGSELKVGTKPVLFEGNQSIEFEINLQWSIIQI